MKILNPIEHIKYATKIKSELFKTLIEPTNIQISYFYKKKKTKVRAQVFGKNFPIVDHEQHFHKFTTHVFSTGVSVWHQTQKISKFNS